MRFILVIMFFWCSANALAQCQYGELLDAVKSDNIEAVKSYHKRGCGLSPTESTSVSALELALILRRDAVFQWLAKADAALIKHFGAEALVSACDQRQQNKAAIELLLAQGVDINALSSHHYNCLYKAAELPDTEFFDYLLSLGANPERKIVPAPEYGVDVSISVKNFIAQRSRDYQALEKAMQKAQEQ